MGARDRRGDLLHPGEHPAGAHDDHAGVREPDTILGGVVFLYTSGSWPLALIVLVASVMIPLGKLVALAYLLITVQRGSIENNRERTQLYRMVEFIGRWSMLDVFVDAFTVALVQLQPLMSVAPGAGVLFFAAVVVLTMLAAETFDPRLIWDAREPEAAAMADEPDSTTLPQAAVVRAEAHADLDRLDHPDARRAGGHRDRRPARLSEGPTITIVFKAAEGIEAGKTFIRYKDVSIGLVTAVQLSEDYTKVLVKAKIAKQRGGAHGRGREVLGRRAAHHAERRVGTQHAALGQLHRLPGRQVDRGAALFFGLDEPPIITDQPGRQFVLKAARLGSLGVGTPIYYRRLQVGAGRRATSSHPTASRSRSRSSSMRPTTSTSPRGRASGT